MGKFILNIDGYIGSWGYSKQWLKDMLAGHENDEVIINMSSLGGAVDHALAMHDQLKEHGNVTVNFTGFVASSGTVIGMGAKTRRMSENALFLVHKVMSWIDEFGLMNEDDIETLIQRLEKEKNENAKITLVLANIYHRITDKSLHDILNLMKEDTWLNAQEVLDWNFIDEVYDPGAGSVNLFEDLEKVAMITSNGFPDPRKKFNKKLQSTTDEDTNTTQTMNKLDDSLTNFFNRISNLLTPNKSNKMKKQFPHINLLLGVENLTPSDQGILTEEQLETISQAVLNGQQAQSDLTEAQQAQQTAEANLATEQQERQTAETNLENERQARQSAETERDQSQQDLSDLVGLIDQINPNIANAKDNSAKVSAIRALLAAKPGAKPAGALEEDTTTDKTDGVDWDTLNSLPHMQEE